jgi:DNA-binding response OmpR family regulator
MPKPVSSENEIQELETPDNEIPPIRLTDISVLLGDKEVSLSPLEYNFIKSLIDLNGEGRQTELIDRIWSIDVELDEKPSLHSLVRRLREKLGDKANDPKYIKTIHGHGYRLINYIPPKSNLD